MITKTETKKNLCNFQLQNEMFPVTFNLHLCSTFNLYQRLKEDLPLARTSEKREAKKQS